MNILKQIYEIYEYLFYRTYIWQLRLWGEKRSPEVAGLLLPTSLFTFVFVGPIVGVLHSLEVPNNEELGILLAVIFTFVAHRLFISDGQYLSIADKYRNETKEKQRQRMKQVWIFLAINLIWVIFCIFLFIKVICSEILSSETRTRSLFLTFWIRTFLPPPNWYSMETI